MGAPTWDDVGLSVMDGEVALTVNWADAELWEGALVTVTAYEPLAMLATVNAVEVNAPFDIEQVWDTAALLNTEQVVSFFEKSEPDT